MSYDHSLERLALLSETGPQLGVQAMLIEVEDLDLQTKTLTFGGLGAAEEIDGLADLEGELGEAVLGKGLQRVGRQRSGNQLREDGCGARGDQAFLVHLGLGGAVVHGIRPVQGLAAEQEEGGTVALEEAELLSRDVALQLGEGDLVEVGIGQLDDGRGSWSRSLSCSVDLGRV